jgi:hypothetical protein
MKADDGEILRSHEIPVNHERLLVGDNQSLMQKSDLASALPGLPASHARFEYCRAPARIVVRFSRTSKPSTTGAPDSPGRFVAGFPHENTAYGDALEV